MIQLFVHGMCHHHDHSSNQEAALEREKGTNLSLFWTVNYSTRDNDRGTCEQPEKEGLVLGTMYAKAVLQTQRKHETGTW